MFRKASDWMILSAVLAVYMAVWNLRGRSRPEPPRAEAPPGTVWMMKGLTYCDEPWNTGPHRSPRAFLEANGVHAQAMAVVGGGGGESCRSCNCGSGKRLSILVPQAEADRARALRFVMADKAPSADEAAAGWR